MKLLEDKIINEGTVLPGNVLKVDGFLNQKLDIALLDAMGKEFAALFKGCGITKILTVEASGIGVACLAAANMGNIPVVFGKKHKTSNLDSEVYSADIYSFTHQTTYTVAIAKRHLCATDKVLIIDDFLANGEAVNGLIKITEQAGATLAGVGIAIEKAFQGGGDSLRNQGIRVESLAMIESMDNCKIKFRS